MSKRAYSPAFHKDISDRALSPAIGWEGFALPSETGLQSSVGSGDLSLQLTTLQVGKLPVNESECWADYIISTPHPDRVGDEVISRGCDLTEYAGAPEWFCFHQDIRWPVARCATPEGQLTVAVFEDRVTARPYFTQSLLEARNCFALVCEAMFPACSIGFDPISEPVPLPLRHGAMKAGYRYDLWKLLETSSVGVGCNPYAGLDRTGGPSFRNGANSFAGVANGSVSGSILPAHLRDYALAQADRFRCILDRGTLAGDRIAPAVRKGMESLAAVPSGNVVQGWLAPSKAKGEHQEGVPWTGPSGRQFVVEGGHVHPYTGGEGSAAKPTDASQTATAQSPAAQSTPTSDDKGGNKHEVVSFDKKSLSFEGLLEQAGKTYPKAGKQVDGRTVFGKVDNKSSIDSSLDNYETLPGIREVSMDDFESIRNNAKEGKVGRRAAADDEKRVEELAEKIKAGGKISPLIVVDDGHPAGPYVLEGGHRFDALQRIGAKSFPALVVIDIDGVISNGRDGKLTSRLVASSGGTEKRLPGRTLLFSTPRRGRNQPMTRKDMNGSSGTAGGWTIPPEQHDEHTKTMAGIKACMKMHEPEGGGTHEAHYHPESGAVQHVHDDGASPEHLEAVKKGLETLKGVHHVMQCKEGPVKEDGWWEAHPGDETKQMLEHEAEKPADDHDAHKPADDDAGFRNKARRVAKFFALLPRSTFKDYLFRMRKKAGESPALRECVSKKIPKLMDEGYGQEQAIAVSFHLCGEEKLALASRRKDSYGTDDAPDDEGASADDAMVGAGEQAIPHGAETWQKLCELLEEAIPLMDDEQGKALAENIIEEVQGYANAKYPDVEFGGEEAPAGDAKAAGGEEDPLAQYRKPQPEATGAKGKRAARRKAAGIIKAYFKKRHHAVFSDAAAHLKEIGEMDPAELAEEHKTHQAASLGHHHKMMTCLKELGEQPSRQADPYTAHDRDKPEEAMDKKDDTAADDGMSADEEKAALAIVAAQFGQLKKELSDDLTIAITGRKPNGYAAAN